VSQTPRFSTAETCTCAGCKTGFSEACSSRCRGLYGATLDGELVVTGLAAPVRIVRDELGMPAIYASSFEDGPGRARLRDGAGSMFQLELIRHWQQDAWRSGWSIGPDQDRLFRTGRHAPDRRAVASRLRPRARRTFEAFSRGVNAYLEADRASPARGVQLLGLNPSLGD
jgi:penicillin amidase